MKDNYLDEWYQALLSLLVSEDQSFNKSDRTGTGTKSLFGIQFRHNMSDGFPLLTTKKMAWKSICTELLWFLRGDTNIKFLLDYDCHIWDGDAYKNYCNSYPDAEKTFQYEGSTIDVRKMTQEEFINQIKTDDEFAKKWGELGPIYGKQWRKWQGWMEYGDDKKMGSLWYDQILRLIHQLKTDPDSRRLMVSAWNVSELDQMILPPCHYGFQVYTRELNNEEKWKQYLKLGLNIEINGIPLELKHMGTPFYPKSLPKRAISLMWNQRSVDVPLGLPFNIASYGLLLEIIAKEVNMVPNQLIGNLGDCHIYLNQIDGVKEQISRTSFELPSIKITERNWYQHEKVKEYLGEKTFREKILSYRPDCFELIGYQSHGKIKIPLSN